MFSLFSVVPWGRSFDEYVRMFALAESDLESRILGCGDGPASFNVEATRRGATVVSCDPLYQFDVARRRALSRRRPAVAAVRGWRLRPRAVLALPLSLQPAVR